MPLPLPETILALLSNWEEGVLSIQEVHEEAERLFDLHSVDAERSKPESIPLEVLTQLDVLNWQLLTSQDIPAMRRFISQREDPNLAWKEWIDYMESVDWEQRKESLNGNDFYSS